ncbi:nucleotide-binding protein [Microbacterium sp. F2]|uniref:nucleotide-binding protein n=1 Tax=Microbacterium sp. F2 TaxID=3422228 RepID=UPI003FCF0184
MTTTTVLRARATVTGTSATFLTPDGRLEHLPNPDGDDIRQVIVRRAATDAARTDTPVELVTTGDRGDHHLLIHPDGTITPTTHRPHPAPAALDTNPGAEGPGERAKDSTPLSPRPQHQDATDPESAQGADVTPARRSFIDHDPGTAAAVSWWDRVLARIGLRESPAVLTQRQAERNAARHWAGCRTIAVVNGKGGVGKTMTTAMLAAVFARLGGGNVLAWDNNDTRGTLGWRTEQGLYDTTIKHLLPAAPRLLAPTAGVADIARFVHHQSDDRYDVLRSNPELLAADQRITEAEFDLLMQVASRYYRVVIFDSGNDESAPRWLRMIDSSYQLVVPTTGSPESAESAALLLDALRDRDHRSRILAENAVVIVTEAEPDPRTTDRIVDGFTGHVRSVARIPFDPALKSGPLRFDTLRPTTRDAWVRTTAAVAHGL